MRGAGATTDPGHELHASGPLRAIRCVRRALKSLAANRLHTFRDDPVRHPVKLAESSDSIVNLFGFQRQQVALDQRAFARIRVNAHDGSPISVPSDDNLCHHDAPALLIRPLGTADFRPLSRVDFNAKSAGQLDRSIGSNPMKCGRNASHESSRSSHDHWPFVRRLCLISSTAHSTDRCGPLPSLGRTPDGHPRTRRISHGNRTTNTTLPRAAGQCRAIGRCYSLSLAAAVRMRGMEAGSASPRRRVASRRVW